MHLQSPNTNHDPNLDLDLIFIGGRGIVMDYHCAKFGDFIVSAVVFIVKTDRRGSTL